MARRPAIRLLVVPQRRAALEKLVLHATNLRIPIVEVEGGSLTALAGFDGHQGIALVVEPRQFATPDDVLARAAERGEPPFILVLDSLEDPHNVGSLLRSAEAAGVHGVLFPKHRQAPLSPSAVKASAGAVEHLLLAPVDDLPGALSDLHARGVRIAGSDSDAPLTARQTDLRGPIAIVVGSEGQGLGRPSPTGRCVHADPDEGFGGLAQRGGRRFDPALRSGGPARGRWTTRGALGRSTKGEGQVEGEGDVRRVARFRSASPRTSGSEAPNSPGRDDGRRGASVDAAVSPPSPMSPPRNGEPARPRRPSRRPRMTARARPRTSSRATRPPSPRRNVEPARRPSQLIPRPGTTAPTLDPSSGSAISFHGAEWVLLR